MSGKRSGSPSLSAWLVRQLECFLPVLRFLREFNPNETLRFEIPPKKKPEPGKPRPPFGQALAVSILSVRADCGFRWSIEGKLRFHFHFHLTRWRFLFRKGTLRTQF